MVAVHNATGQEVPLTWLLLDIQSTMDLIANTKMLVMWKGATEEELSKARRRKTKKQKG